MWLRLLAPGVLNVTFKAPGLEGIPAPVRTTPLPPPPPTPINSHIVGSLKHLVLSLPEVTPVELILFYAFHWGNFSESGAKEKLVNLAHVQTYQTFTVIRSSDSWIKIVHSLAKYMAPFRKETGDRNIEIFFGLKETGVLDVRHQL